MENINLQIIVLGFNNFEATTRRCLDSLLPLINPMNSQTLVFDNGSSDDSALRQKLYIQKQPQLQAAYSDKNLGFAAGMNQAVKLNHSEWILLVGSDTEFHPQSLERIIFAMKSAQNDWGLICPVTNEAGNAQRLKFQGSSANEVFSEFDHKINSPINHISTIYRADFFCVGIRRKLWDELNGLDLSYGKGYYEDFDFCMRAKRLGYKCVMIEDALVFHQGSASFKLQKDQKSLLKINKHIFKDKFPNAELRHRRLDNLKVLRSYLDLTPMNMTSSLKELINWRTQMLHQESPKSFWKKWRWKVLVKDVTSALKQVNEAL